MTCNIFEAIISIYLVTFPMLLLVNHTGFPMLI